MCIKNNVPMPDDPNIEELDNLSMVENQDILANFNRNIDLILGRQQRNGVIGYLSHRKVLLLSTSYSLSLIKKSLN